MCGLVGIWLDEPSVDRESLGAIARRLAAPLISRGPDDEGTWVDPQVGMAIGFRRLAVVDLSPAGAQPMATADGRFVLAMNGEIYNATNLRQDLEERGEAPSWRGHSDTEVLLEAIARWGVEKALDRSDGMFAFALWDRRERRLVLVRDRFGEKPLYYGRTARGLVFGSQLAALRRAPGFDARLSDAAVREYFALGWIGGSRCIYADLHKVAPGELVVVRERATRPPERLAWWSASAAVRAARGRAWTGTFDEAVDAVEDALAASVSARLRADVPVGVLLSGGVDSTCVLGALPREASVETFTIGFDDSAHDEAPFAQAVARHLGRDATTLRVGANEALAVIPDLSRRWDEPFADSSEIPTSLVAALARERVTVVLGGDGGDELFGGYDWYRSASKRTWWWRQVLADHRAGWAARAPNAMRVQRNLHVIWRESPVVGGDTGRATRLPPAAAEVPPGLGRGRALQWADTLSYLPDDLLVKVDRATMGVGLEARAPFLAPAVFDLAWRLPDAFLVGRDQGKRVLRALLHRRLPADLVDRPKQGFSVPLDAWLRGPLAGWMTDLLSETRLRRDGLLDAAVVSRLCERHRSGHEDGGRRLWSVLMFQAWLASSAGPGGSAEAITP